MDLPCPCCEHLLEPHTIRHRGVLRNARASTGAAILAERETQRRLRSLTLLPKTRKQAEILMADSVRRLTELETRSASFDALWAEMYPGE